MPEIFNGKGRSRDDENPSPLKNLKETTAQNNGSLYRKTFSNS